MAEISPLPSAIPACPDPCVHPDRWALGGTLSPLHKAIHHHPPPVRPLLMIRSRERGPPVSRVGPSGEDFRRRHARHVNLKNTRTTSPLHNHTTPPPHHDLPARPSIHGPGNTGRLNRHPKKTCPSENRQDRLQSRSPQPVSCALDCNQGPASRPGGAESLERSKKKTVARWMETQKPKTPKPEPPTHRTT